MSVILKWCALKPLDYVLTAKQQGEEKKKKKDGGVLMKMKSREQMLKDSSRSWVPCDACDREKVKNYFLIIFTLFLVLKFCIYCITFLKWNAQ